MRAIEERIHSEEIERLSHAIAEEVFARINAEDSKRREEFKASQAKKNKCQGENREELHIGDKLFSPRNDVRIGDYYLKDGKPALLVSNRGKSDIVSIKELVGLFYKTKVTKVTIQFEDGTEVDFLG